MVPDWETVFFAFVFGYCLGFVLGYCLGKVLETWRWSRKIEEWTKVIEKPQPRAREANDL